MCQRIKSIVYSTTDNPDVALATLGFIFSIPATFYIQAATHRPVYTAIGIVALLACAGYLLLRRRFPPSAVFSLRQIGSTSRLYILHNTLFFLLFLYSVLSIWLTPELYTKPLGYFVSTALMAAMIAIEILFLSVNKPRIYFTIFKIIVVGLSLQWSQLAIFPNVAGIDPWFHQMFTSRILDAGHIPEGYVYSDMPSFHLMVAATSLVTGWGYKMATMFSVGFLQVVCGTLFIFLLGKLIYNIKAGLMAALLLMIANWYIHFGFWTIPNTIAIVLIPVIIYLLFKIGRSKPIIAISLSTVLMVVIISTHTIGAVCLGTLLFLMWLGTEMYNRMRYRVVASGKIFLFAFLLFTLATISYWTFVSGDIGRVVRVAESGFSGQAFDIISPEGIPLPEGLQVSKDDVLLREDAPLPEQFFNNSGLLLFFALAFIGSFVLLSKRVRNNYGFTLTISGLIILAITFFGIVTSRAIHPDRWSYFSQVLMTIPVGMALLWLTGLLRSNVVKASLLGIIAFSIAFLMTLSPQSNMDNRTFSPNVVVRYAFTESELQAAETISAMWEGEIGSDWHYAIPFKFQLDAEFKSIDGPLVTADFASCEDFVIMIREEVIQHPFKCLSTACKLKYDPRQVLESERFFTIYDSGSVFAFR